MFSSNCFIMVKSLWSLTSRNWFQIKKKKNEAELLKELTKLHKHSAMQSILKNLHINATYAADDSNYGVESDCFSYYSTQNLNRSSCSHASVKAYHSLGENNNLTWTTKKWKNLTVIHLKESYDICGCNQAIVRWHTSCLAIMILCSTVFFILLS